MADLEAVDQEGWQALGEGFPASPASDADLAVIAAGLDGAAATDLRTAYAPLARIVDDRRRERAGRDGDPFLVGVAGGVASGKTTTSRALASLLREGVGASVEVVSTDGFLLSNVELEAARLTTRKGFPESYDETALLAFVDAARAGGFPLDVPVYDHTLYDVMAERRTIEPVEVLVVEGVNALQSLPRSGASLAERFDLGVYVDVDEADLREWFMARMVRLRAAAAESDEPSFYDSFAALSDERFQTVAEMVWSQINRPNLVDHIAPTRDRAEVVVEKAADHSVRGALIRA